MGKVIGGHIAEAREGLDGLIEVIRHIWKGMDITGSA